MLEYFLDTLARYVACLHPNHGMADLGYVLCQTVQLKLLHPDPFVILGL